MPTRIEAEENLRIIRSLMERATIYRAISAPTALVGGVASLITATALAFVFRQRSEAAGVGAQSLFLSSWLGVLAVTAVANTFFLWREARRRREVFLSPGMRTAVRAFSPSFLVAAFLTILAAWFPELPQRLPPAWMVFYGLGLLATQHFAPRSITILGWCFLACGLIAVLPLAPILFLSPLFYANSCMGATFGLFHLVYTICTWAKPTGSSDV